jgi:hypothetical protein
MLRLAETQRAKKGHGKSIRRFAMTSILKRDSRVSRPPDKLVQVVSASLGESLTRVLAKLPASISGPPIRTEAVIGLKTGACAEGTADRNQRN